MHYMIYPSQEPNEIDTEVYTWNHYDSDLFDSMVCTFEYSILPPCFQEGLQLN
jgi:hypothetical protein